MSVLALDIGNSRIGAGVFNQGKTNDPAIRIARENIDAELGDVLKKLTQGQKPAGAVICSVAPELTGRVAEMIQKICGIKAQIVGTDLTVPLKTKLADEKTVGTDRLCAALSAYVNTQQACVIISAGTALVVDCLDADGVFLGGAIGPGLAMGAKAMHAWAAQLPEADLKAPEHAFGRNTMEALNLGLYAAARGAVRELVERYSESLGAWPHVVATGGDANRLLGDSGLVDSLIPDLVLQGAALAWETTKAQRE
ncbi:MAG TPA: type III pantothenate kinase [Phycisphaerae bacterium]|nr:type III pantothenate kinase [Phycisphaerae bacterium]